jgi:membrane-associated phospholipid phosphatase
VDRRLPRDENGLAPDRRLARQLLLVAATALLALLALAIWARFASPAPWEPGVLAALALGHDPWADAVRAMNVLGNLPVWGALVAILAVAFAATRGLFAGLLVGLSIAADLAAFVIKLLVERARPEGAVVEHFLGTDNFSFPSGHVVRAVALVAVVAWLLAPPALRVRLAIGGGLLAGVVMGYARVALGVHWPTDALGGTLLGIGFFALTARLALADATPTAT